MLKYKEKNIRHIKDQIEYALLRAHNSMGGMIPSKHDTFIVEDNKFTQREIEYTPALIKSVCEIIDNATDEATECFYELGNVIKINIIDDKIIVEDNGRGIPTIPTKDCENNTPMFVTALTNVQAGSNFDDDENNNKKGTNGIGASMAFILSKEANCEVKTNDTWGLLNTKENTRHKSYEIREIKHKKTGTKITLIPDYKRFGVTSFNDEHKKVLYAYIVNQAVCYPKIKFYYNDVLVKASSFNDYIKYYNDKACLFYSDEILDIGLYPTEEYKFTYFINGLNVYDGGDALNYIVNKINSELKEKVPKKINKISTSDFKNKIGYIVNYKNRKNLKWSGQTKQKCESSFSMLESPKINWSLLCKELYKNDDLIKPIIETFTLMEEVKAKRALKSKPKKQEELLTDKYFPATKNKKYLVISEGTSARASQLKALGNFDFGFFELTGVPSNVLELSITKFKQNKRGLPELYDIIKNENYDYILLGSDADADGSHINGLLIAFIYKFFKEKLENNKVGFLKMPLIVVRDKKENLVESLYSMDEYTNFMENNNVNKYVFDYKKGYGSLNGPDEMVEFIERDGIDKIIDIIEWCDGDEEIINQWLLDENVVERKRKILDNEFNMNSII